MSLNKSLIAELQHEAASTRKLLLSVPTELFSWQPHDKSMTMERLAKHVADLQGWALLILAADETDMAARVNPITAATTTEEFVAIMDENVEQSIVALENATDEELNKKWLMRRGEMIIRELPKFAGIRFMMMNHLIHHRGQLSVYLRLNDIHVPGLYGPSADDRIVMEAAAATK